MTAPAYPRVASLRTAEAFRAHLAAQRIPLEFDDDMAAPGHSPLAQPLELDGVRIGNRFCILPMEGWDGTFDGRPGELTRRRWRHFGESGAKLIWGGEAVAVRQDGRANPQQLLLTPDNLGDIASLRDDLVAAHRARYGPAADADLLVGLQLTHSGRYARPRKWDRPEPLAACVHPALDRRMPVAVHVLTDGELDQIAEDIVAAARLAASVGFRFVDVKHCHGYLGHELLGATTRPGRYGGPLDRRLTFLRRVVDGIRAEAPGLLIGVRVSVFDSVPYRKRADGVGEPEPAADSAPGFGLLAGDDVAAALDDARALLRMLDQLDVRWICTTAGSPYYCPHILRPAFFPPVDGYGPPEDPLRGVARQMQATRILKAEFPRQRFIGSGYSYLQQWLPHVAQAAVRQGWVDSVGLGRMVLSYPGFPADVLAGRELQRGLICRTFSDCTTGPRLGKVSGCYPLDPLYKARPDAATILQLRTGR